MYRSYAAVMEAELIPKYCTTVTSLGVMWQTIIHALFILSAIGIAMTDRVMAKANAPVLGNGHH